MRFETTVQRPVEASGVGLHSGVPVNIRILPAPVSTGSSSSAPTSTAFPIPASWRHVARVSYATSLMRQGVLISTTEHLLSVLYSMGIDNVYVEIDNLEVPILDGSGLPFVRLIEQAGIRQYRRKRRYLRIRRPISVEDKGKRISILPDEVFPPDLRYGLSRAGGPPVARTRSHARAICVRDRFRAHLRLAERSRPDAQHGPDPRRQPGKRRLLHAARVLNPGGLRAPDECCRHKALDLIGDLALLGRPLLGHVIAERAGHAMHAALVARIMSDPSLYEIITFDQLASRVTQALVS